MSKTIEMIEKWLEDHKEDILSNLVKLLQYPSIEGPSAENAPFGQPVRGALDFMLGLGKDAGMRTKDIEGFAGYAEFGQGEKLIMSLGHLDVVPVGDGWKFDPFSATIHDGYIYARGAVDDKGPTMAAFYASRAIMECVPDLKVRIRNVFGCDEESGHKCIEHYMKTEELPTYGIAPDAAWPCLHAEKGIVHFDVAVPKIKGDFELVDISGGQRPSIVMDACHMVVRVSASIKDEIKEKLAKSWDHNLKWQWDGNLLKIESLGRAAHALDPHKGDSAAIRAFRFLFEIAPLSCQKDYEQLLDISSISGGGLGIAGSDDVSKNLTSNLGVISSSANDFTMTFNVRYPVTWKWADIEKNLRAKLCESYEGYKFAEVAHSPPLYIPVDSPLVKAVCDVYAEVTGERLKPGVSSGGTYARDVPNTVSIGTCWRGDGEIHAIDERFKVEHLYKICRIYAHILYRLATLD